MKTEPQKQAIDVSSSAVCHRAFSGSRTAVSKVMLQVGNFGLNTSCGIEAIPAKTLSVSGLSGQSLWKFLQCQFSGRKQIL